MVRKTKNIIALVTALIVLLFELYFFGSSLVELSNIYLYNRFHIDSFGAGLLLVVMFLLIAGIIVLTYLIIKNFKKFLIVLVIPCWIVLFFLNSILLMCITGTVESYTDDTANYLVIDEDAESLLERKVDEDIMDFNNANVKEYEYNYINGPFSYEYFKIDTKIKLSDEEYLSYRELIESKDNLEPDADFSDTEGVYRYVLIFTKYDYSGSYTEECYITFYEESNEVCISVLLEYVG